MEELDVLGLAEQVRVETPALHGMRLSFDGIEAGLAFGKGRTAHCLPRQTLDAILQRAAVEAGAELRDRTRVMDLLRDADGTVCGVLTRHAGAEPEPIRARLVVGADGRNSTIAQLVGAEEYLGYDGPRFVYWAYWRAPVGWDMHEFHSSFERDSARGIFPTTEGRILIATVPRLEELHRWRGDHAAAYAADIGAYAPVSMALEGQSPLGQVRGVLRPRYFFRVSGGEGWALIGDAGHHKEFVVGLGISDALGDARALAEAIRAEGLESPLVRSWWRQRDAKRIELYRWGRELGRAEPVDAVQRLMATRLARSPELASRYGEVIAGDLPPDELIPRAAAGRWLLGGLLRGNPGLVAPLIRTVWRARADAREQGVPA